MCLEKRDIILDSLEQVRQSIINLQKWNEDISDMNDLMLTSGGMQDLAGNCMMIAAIAEGFKKIDKMTDGTLLVLRPEIPWRQVFALRNRIVHGYFDIDVEVISEVIKEELSPLLEATDYFISVV